MTPFYNCLQQGLNTTIISCSFAIKKQSMSDNFFFRGSHLGNNPVPRTRAKIKDAKEAVVSSERLRGEARRKLEINGGTREQQKWQKWDRMRPPVWKETSVHGTCAVHRVPAFYCFLLFPIVSRCTSAVFVILCDSTVPSLSISIDRQPLWLRGTNTLFYHCF